MIIKIISFLIFFCFGQYEINHYKKNKIKILDFKKIEV